MKIFKNDIEKRENWNIYKINVEYYQIDKREMESVKAFRNGKTRKVKMLNIKREKRKCEILPDL